jgi:hypothetical protein
MTRIGAMQKPKKEWRCAECMGLGKYRQPKTPTRGERIESRRKAVDG